MATPPTPPPVIGKIGPYTVFLTPPATPAPTPSHSADAPQLRSPSPGTVSALARPSPAPASPRPAPVVAPADSPLPPPVQPPPTLYMKPERDRFGFLWDAVAKLQNAHSSVDQRVANWLGLNQSKYQWALDDYYEAKGLEKGDAKAREVTSTDQCV